MKKEYQLKDGSGLARVVEVLEEKGFKWRLDKNLIYHFQLANGELALYSDGHLTMDGTTGFFTQEVLQQVLEVLPYTWIAEYGVAQAESEKWFCGNQIKGGK